MKPSTTVYISSDEAVVYCNDPLGLDITPANGYDTEEDEADCESALRQVPYFLPQGDKELC